MKIEYEPNLKITNIDDLKVGDIFKYDGQLYIKSEIFNEAYSIDRNVITTFTGTGCTPVKKYVGKLILMEV